MFDYEMLRLIWWALLGVLQQQLGESGLCHFYRLQNDFRSKVRPICADARPEFDAKLSLRRQFRVDP